MIVALDFPEQAKALELVEDLDPGLCRLKVGKEMFTRYGPSFVEKLRKLGFEIFLDLKFHDIPNTVAAACDAATVMTTAPSSASNGFGIMSWPPRQHDIRRARS